MIARSSGNSSMTNVSRTKKAILVKRELSSSVSVGISLPIFKSVLSELQQLHFGLKFDPPVRAHLHFLRLLGVFQERRLQLKNKEAPVQACRGLQAFGVLQKNHWKQSALRSCRSGVSCSASFHDFQETKTALRYLINVHREKLHYHCGFGV